MNNFFNRNLHHVLVIDLEEDRVALELRLSPIPAAYAQILRLNLRIECSLEKRLELAISIFWKSIEPDCFSILLLNTKTKPFCDPEPRRFLYVIAPNRDDLAAFLLLPSNTAAGQFYPS
jgi:hypothetical protein